MQRRTYLWLALALFALEVGIALGFHDAVIRSFVGDVLVVGLLYAGLRGGLLGPVRLTVLAVWLLACLIEFGQAFDLVRRLGLEQVTLARIVLGTTFDLKDLLAYTLGAALILGLERRRL